MLVLDDVTVALGERELLSGVSFSVSPSESVAIMGPSGSGKTTLLNCISGINVPRAGDVWLDDVKVNALSRNDRARLRLDRIGVVFQFGELLAEFNALENIALPARLAGSTRQAALAAAQDVIERLGLAHLAERRPESLSGGEQQRIAIARALTREPRLLVADEPTGMLDEQASKDVVAMLRDVATASGAALVMVTHDEDVAMSADRLLRVRAGRLVDDSAVSN
jgi:putative ABC transport system ATP-binding protein